MLQFSIVSKTPSDRYFTSNYLGMNACEPFRDIFLLKVKLATYNNKLYCVYCRLPSVSLFFNLLSSPPFRSFFPISKKSDGFFGIEN